MFIWKHISSRFSCPSKEDFTVRLPHDSLFSLPLIHLVFSSYSYLTVGSRPLAWFLEQPYYNNQKLYLPTRTSCFPPSRSPKVFIPTSPFNRVALVFISCCGIKYKFCGTNLTDMQCIIGLTLHQLGSRQRPLQVLFQHTQRSECPRSQRQLQALLNVRPSGKTPLRVRTFVLIHFFDLGIRIDLFLPENNFSRCIFSNMALLLYKPKAPSLYSRPRTMIKVHTFYQDMPHELLSCPGIIL